MRGLDHGAWVPLSFLFPDADIPVTQLSIQPDEDPAWHIALGRALRPLREQGVLIVGSGSISHNLSAIFKHPQNESAPEWVTEFCDWMAKEIKAGDLETLSAYRTLAPHAVQNHPTDEHLLPLFVALGAANKIENALHSQSGDDLRNAGDGYVVVRSCVAAGVAHYYRCFTNSFKASGDRLVNGIRCAVSSRA